MPKYQALYPGQKDYDIHSSAIIEYENDEDAIMGSVGLVNGGSVKESIVVRCGYGQFDQRVVARVYRGQPKTVCKTEVVRY